MLLFLIVHYTWATEIRNKKSPIQISNPEKVDPHPKIFGQPNQQDTNRHCHMISAIMALGFEESPVTSFKNSNQLTCQLSINQQPLNTSKRFAFMIQIHSSSQTSRRNQGIKRSPTNFALPTSPLQAPASERAGDICSCQKLTSQNDITCPSSKETSSLQISSQSQFVPHQNHSSSQ